MIEPAEYTRGFSEFLGVRIDLSKKPLIPRPETEFWVEKAIEEIKADPSSFRSSGQNLRILDIFCGSGCIGLAVKKYIRGAKVFFADKYKYFNHPNFVKSDVFSNIKGKYDYIFANPPYVATNKKHLVQKSVLEYEPHSALFAGADGLFYIKKFFKQAKSHLNPGGKIFMEFSPEQKKEIEKILKTLRHGSGRFCGIEFHKDQFDRWRWVVIKIDNRQF